jgi:SET domain-containing protein
MDHHNPVNEKLVTGFSRLQQHLHIKDSPIQGKGLFSDVDIQRGEVLWEIVGEKIQHEYNPRLAAENPNWIGTGPEEWLMMGPGDIAIYLNHSCEPNVIVNEKLEIIAMRAIRKNEELLLDYSTTELDPYWKMECSCGARDCRKILRSFQYLPEELRKRYGKFIAPGFTRVTEAMVENKVER